ncbi:hypothetical protein CLV30_106212 [Haloactinopolyspora alba]|uniref:Uncharacterized protein n=1 Tax=Haloactinopolyspora alba TaxID=648780 RepID=A0A2P8E468_9ACTN|nr:hypothetical protein [Haloactinopolyspora alba]PSL04207.1 hypothetical protein CLV30_106212 [Haloactinopolyspora alba]
MTETRAQRLGHAGAGTLRVLTEVVVATVVLGAGMGVLWWLLAPEVTGVVVGGELAVDAHEGQKLFDRDARFALLAGACGLVTAVTFAARHPRRPVTVLLALAVLGVGGSLLAQLTGWLLGPSGDVSGLADGTEHAVPLRMDTQAGLIVWSMVATVVVAVVAVFREDRTPFAVPGQPAPK